jgi:Leucine-rich repeat (LRR) protein
LYIGGNIFTPSVNNQILHQLALNGVSTGEFYSTGGRTSSSNADYDNLLNELGWTLSGLDLIIPPTFITSHLVGESFSIILNTSTGYWKYNHDGSDSSLFSPGDEKIISVTNANGEFTLISCDSEGIVSGDIILLDLQNRNLTSFDGTGLSSLTSLNLKNNQLTSFDGTDLSGLTILNLMNNQLTSFDGTDLSSLTSLNLRNNPLTTFICVDMWLITDLGFNRDGLINNSWNITTLTSFDGTGLSGLTELSLFNNQLTSFDGTGLSSLTSLNLSGNQLTPSVNNQVLQQLNQNGLTDGGFQSSGGRTSASNTDYDNLVSLGWYFEGLDLIIPPTFITSKAVGESITIYVQTSTEYWKYNHDGSDSSVFGNGQQSITITNANGEFTIISCDLDGTVSGDVTYLALNNNQLTSFDGTDLSSLTVLYLNSNQLTSLDGFIFPTSLIALGLGENQLTSFDGTGLSSLTSLSLDSNQLTSLDGFIFPTSLTYLGLGDNQLTSFDGTGLSSLTNLSLYSNQLTSLEGFILPTSLTLLNLSTNQLTSFDGTGLSSLTSLTELDLNDNLLTSLDEFILPTSLIQLYLYGNPMTPSVNNQILNQLNQNGLSGGEFTSSNGRTSASNTDYDNLVSLGWNFDGLNLITPPVVGNRRCRYRTH